MIAQRASKGWSATRINDWYEIQSRNQVRDYRKDVVSRLNRLPANEFIKTQYGALSIDKDRFPLFSIACGDSNGDKPTILITGGVHGYEPSGVEASMRFLENVRSGGLTKTFNFLVFPCISPWAYEHDHRWNNEAEDPNRCFSKDGGVSYAEECDHFMNAIENANLRFSACVDMHETPDRDVELRVMRAERFGQDLSPDYKVIPQGYYLMLSKSGDSHTDDNRMQFGRSIINQVRKVSPIAPERTVLGKDNHGGISISSPVKGTMREFLGHYSDYVGVTEVYPDHKAMSREKSVAAQLRSIDGAVRYIRAFVA